MTPDWSLANCLTGDPEAFFPTAEGNTAHAKAICRPCPIKADCGLYAIEHRLIGVWGGLSDRERASLLRKEKRALSVVHSRGNGDIMGGNKSGPQLEQLRPATTCPSQPEGVLLMLDENAHQDTSEGA